MKYDNNVWFPWGSITGNDSLLFKFNSIWKDFGNSIVRSLNFGHGQSILWFASFQTHFSFDLLNDLSIIVKVIFFLCCAGICEYKFNEKLLKPKTEHPISSENVEGV